MIRQKKVLIVEDNKINREILNEILSGTYEVLEAKNGKAALEILQRNRGEISLILLDVMMPVMDGYTFLDLIKKDIEFALIPVIVLTQRDSEKDEIDALAHGANDFVPKPYRPQVILHRVASLIKFREAAAMVDQFQYDRLTGHYTKEFFYQKVRDLLDATPDQEYTVLCVNLENVKLHNDTYGRKAGENLLLEAAEILPKRVGEDALCCRYSADGFLCLVERKRERNARKYFDEERKKERSQLVDKMSVKLGVYEITDRTISVEQMCDRALLAAESISGIYGRYLAVYDDVLRENLLREKEITDTMAFALRQKQFLIYFQPEYSLKDGKMVGAEALVRWQHPEWGLLSPKEFVPLLEKNGFISSLDTYIWESVCSKLKEWKQKGYPMVPISINVSREDFYESYLFDTVWEIAQKYEIDPGYLHLEIKERTYLENPDQIICTAEELRKRGFCMELDDFGEGTSSLNMLTRLPLDALKLDKEFLWREMKKPLGQSILPDMIHLAHRMQLPVKAEGVETEEQKKRLEELDCDYAQGYLFAKPMPVEAFEKLLKCSKI